MPSGLPGANLAAPRHEIQQCAHQRCRRRGRREKRMIELSQVSLQSHTDAPRAVIPIMPISRFRSHRPAAPCRRVTIHGEGTKRTDVRCLLEYVWHREGNRFGQGFEQRLVADGGVCPMRCGISTTFAPTLPCRTAALAAASAQTSFPVGDLQVGSPELDMVRALFFNSCADRNVERVAGMPQCSGQVR